MPETNPPPDCPLCPRLVEFRQQNQSLYPAWFNAPVPNWGDPNAHLLIIGLAPGLRGANRTGRPFTGDYAGDLLYQTLKRCGMATGDYRADPDDSLQLTGSMIVNAVRCVPPQNKPTGPEISTCRRFLTATLDAHRKGGVYLALGRIAHDSVLAALDEKRSAFGFSHGARHRLTAGGVLYDSYHCSRYNTNTGRLTEAMFEEVVFRAADEARALSAP